MHPAQLVNISFRDREILSQTGLIVTNLCLLKGKTHFLIIMLFAQSKGRNNRVLFHIFERHLCGSGKTSCPLDDPGVPFQR